MQKDLMDSEQWKNIKEVASGIIPEGVELPPPNPYSTKTIKSDGFYPCDTFYITGYLDDSLNPNKYKNPDKNGPIYLKDNSRRFPDFRSGPENIKRNDVSVITNANQTVYVFTSQEADWSSPSGNNRLFIIKPNSHVDVNQKMKKGSSREKDGFILRKGTIKQDKNFRTVASLDAAMEYYTAVKDTTGSLISKTVDTARETVKAYVKKLNKDKLTGMDAAVDVMFSWMVADKVIQAISIFSGVMGYYIGKLPLAFFLAEYGFNVAQNILHANMAYGVACACGQKPKSDDEFKTDLYFLFGSDDEIAATVANIAKAVGKGLLPKFDNYIPQPGTVLGEVLSKEKLYEWIGKTEACKAAVRKAMQTRVGQYLSGKLAGVNAGAIAKKTPVVTAYLGGLCNMVDATKFGYKAKNYYLVTKKKKQTVTQVSVSPHVVTGGLGAKLQFTADVTGTNNPDKTVKWSLEGDKVSFKDDSSGTSIDQKGLLKIGMKQPVKNFTVKATSTVDPNKNGTATVKMPTPPTSVVVDPPSAELNRGTAKRFTVTVKGTDKAEKKVIWSITGASFIGTSISQDGLLTIGKTQHPCDITVIATSIADSSRIGKAKVKVVTKQAIEGVTVDPKSASVKQGATQKFTATVKGTNNLAKTVKWSLKGASSGTSISEKGLLTVSARQRLEPLMVIATSTVDSSRSGMATVKVSEKVEPIVKPTIKKVTVSPKSATVKQGAAKQFTATVEGTNKPAQTVTWSVTGGGSGTSISAKGLLKIGANQKQATLTVKAKSTVDTSKSGTATVTVPAAKPGPKPPKPEPPKPGPKPPKPDPKPTPPIIGGRTEAWKKILESGTCHMKFKTPIGGGKGNGHGILL